MKKLFKVSVLTIPYDNIHVYVKPDPHNKDIQLTVRTDYKDRFSRMNDKMWNMQAPDELLYDKGQFLGYLFRSVKSRNIDLDNLIDAVKIAAHSQKRVSK